MITINNKSYLSVTSHKCPVCGGQDIDDKTPDDRYLHVKQRFDMAQAPSIVLECPNCEYYITVRESTLGTEIGKTIL